MPNILQIFRSAAQQNPLSALLRDQPAASPQPAPHRLLPQPVAAPGPMPQPAKDQQAMAAIAESRLLPTMIEADDLTAGVFNLNQWSTLAYYEVPQGVILRLPQGHNFRMYVKAQATKAGQNSGAPANPSTITCPGIVQTLQTEPAYPTQQDGDVVVWCEVAGVWSQADVTAVNYGTNVVSYTEPANCTNVEAYYVHNRGLWRIRVQRQLGNSDTSAISVANGSFGGTHLVDQANVETSPKWPRPTVLIPGQKLQFDVDSSLTHTWGTRAQQTLILHGYAQMVTVTDKSLLRRIAEIDLREGL